MNYLTVTGALLAVALAVSISPASAGDFDSNNKCHCEGSGFLPEAIP